jgi:hypothetical protein
MVEAFGYLGNQKGRFSLFPMIAIAVWSIYLAVAIPNAIGLYDGITEYGSVSQLAAAKGSLAILRPLLLIMAPLIYSFLASAINLYIENRNENDKPRPDVLRNITMHLGLLLLIGFCLILVYRILSAPISV